MGDPGADPAARVNEVTSLWLDDSGIALEDSAAGLVALDGAQTGHG